MNLKSITFPGLEGEYKIPQTAADVGAASADSIGTNKVFNKLTDIGITEFPTTMKTVANSMPKNSTLMLDSRDIISGGTNEISDLGINNSGMYMFMRGNSNARVSLLHIYSATSATTSYMNFGCYAVTNDVVTWIRAASNMVKLWENASPTSDFAAQTIALDLSGYDVVYIDAVRSTASKVISGSTMISVGGLSGFLMGTTDQLTMIRREVKATTTGVVVSGYTSANNSNGTSNELPYRIYGIKGVSK